MAAGTPHAEPEHADRRALEQVLPAEAGRRRRFALRIERHASRLLDPDNFHGGTKALTDCLRQSGIIAEDDPESLEVTFTQVKVRHRIQEGTRVFVRELV